MFYIAMLISKRLVTTDISYDLSEVWLKFDMEFVWSIEAQNLREYCHKALSLPRAKISKTREKVKPLGNKRNDTDVFFNNLSTSFSTVLGLTIELPATHTVHQIPR